LILKKIILLFLLIPFSAFSQKVIFCEKVDHIGNPTNASNEFVVGSQGGFLKVLIRLNRKANTNPVIIDIFRLSEGKKNLENSVRMKINPFMTWFYKEFTFFKPGEYEVYVYDEKEKMIAAGKVLIKSR
jgi:hypothetical protein